MARILDVARTVLYLLGHKREVKMRKREAGFSLMEIMVATAIIAILSAIAIPNYIGWLPGHRLRSAAADIRSNLQLVKMRAIRQNRQCAILFNPGGGTYQVIDGGPDGTYGTGDDNVVKTVNVAEYGSGVTLNNVTYGGNAVVFMPTGLNQAMGYAFVSNNRGDQCRAGTNTLAGVVVLESFINGSWQ
jgi:type IV fimbrial biogenesis protein FimT